MVATPLIAACPAAGGPAVAPPGLSGSRFSLVALPASGLVPDPLPASAPPSPAIAPPPPGVVPGAGTGPTPAPAPVVTARPGGSGGSGGSGGGGSGPVFVPGDPTFVTGIVRAAFPDEPGPAIAGATVRALGVAPASEAVTAADGSFALGGVPTGSALVVTAPGHVPAVAIGWDAGPLVLHLATGSPFAGRFESFVPVAGDVVTGAGTPAAGAVVMGANAAGTAFGPLIADENGHFAGHAISYEGAQAAGLAAFAFTRGADERLDGIGVATDLTVGPGSPALALTTRGPAGEVKVVVGPTPVGARLAQVYLRAPNGFKVSIASWDPAGPAPDVPFFRVDGAELVAQVDVEAADHLARSVWRRGLDEPAELAADLLPFPPAPGIGRGAIADGRAVTWPPTAGATAYRVTLARGEDPKPLWEAYTPEPRLTFAGLPALAAVDRLEILAMEGAGATFRRIAGLPAGPPSYLRWFDPAALDRYATRIVPL